MKAMMKQRTIERKSKKLINLVKKSTNAAMMTNSTMLKVFVTTATISLAEIRNHGNAHMKNYTLQACARTATSTTTTARKDWKRMEAKLNF